MDSVFYYVEYSRSSRKFYIVCSALTPYLMTGDDLLFSSYDACKRYCDENGWEVEE